MTSSRCILCETEHSRLWEDGGPDMYCASCAVARADARGSMHQIAPLVWVGDIVAAELFTATGWRICVHEDPPEYPGGFSYIPILSKVPANKLDRAAVASREKLNEAALMITAIARKHGNPVLVHCHGGIERSPLTIAWWLSKYENPVRYPDLAAAYAHIKRIRPIVADRRSWAPT